MQETEKPDLAKTIQFYGASEPKRSTGTYKTRCFLPGHSDRTPSAAVYLDKQYFRCFTCDFSGDSWAIIQFMEGCDFKAALQFARDHLGADMVIGARDLGKPAKKKKLSIAERRAKLE